MRVDSFPLVQFACDDTTPVRYDNECGKQNQYSGYACTHDCHRISLPNYPIDPLGGFVQKRYESVRTKISKKISNFFVFIISI